MIISNKLYELYILSPCDNSKLQYKIIDDNNIIINGNNNIIHV